MTCCKSSLTFVPIPTQISPQQLSTLASSLTASSFSSSIQTVSPATYTKRQAPQKSFFGHMTNIQSWKSSSFSFSDSGIRSSSIRSSSGENMLLRGLASDDTFPHPSQYFVPAPTSSSSFSLSTSIQNSLPQRHVSSVSRQPTSLHCSASDDVTPSSLSSSSSSSSSSHAPTSSPSITTTTSSLPQRYVVVGLLFLSFVICSMDRINVSVAILPMAEAYGWSNTTAGVMQSAFFWGYVLTQIPGGYLSEKYGGKNILILGVIAWSLMTLVTPIAARYNFAVLLGARALLGFGEGVALPSMNQLAANWVPPTETSRSLALIHSGMQLGSVIGLLTCPYLITAFGWPSVFYVFGAAGFVWLIFFQMWAAESPQKSTRISDKERDLILTARPPPKVKREYPLSYLLSKPAVWAINCAHFCYTWGYFIMVTWLPTYFNKQLGFNLSSSAWFAVLPWITMFIGANLAGYLCDHLNNSTSLSTTQVRKLMQSLAFLLPSVFLLFVINATSPFWAIFFMALALGASAFSAGGLYSNHQDIGPNCAGILLGISNTCGALPGVFGVALTGWILDKFNSWSLIFSIAIFFYIFGTIVYNIFGTAERIFE